MPWLHCMDLRIMLIYHTIGSFSFTYRYKRRIFSSSFSSFHLPMIRCPELCLKFLILQSLVWYTFSRFSFLSSFASFQYTIQIHASSVSMFITRFLWYSPGEHKCSRPFRVRSQWQWTHFWRWRQQGNVFFCFLPSLLSFFLFHALLSSFCHIRCWLLKTLVWT